MNDQKMKRIMVVEDESIVAMDIQRRLESLGYEVADVFATGEEAVEKTRNIQPDLILMDIMLAGEMNGMEAADHIRHQFDIPIIYLTAYADEKTLQSVKQTQPYGYILKPFEERELHTTIEMGIYRHKLEQQLKESRQWFETTLKCIGDAVIATDAHCKIVLMNTIAETLTGWQEKDAVDRDLTEIFNIIHEETRATVTNPAVKVLRDKVIAGLANHTVLIAKDGTELPIDDSAAPIKDERGNVIGVVLVFRDIIERRKAEREQQQQRTFLRKVIDTNPNLIFVKDRNGKFTLVNKAVADIYGTTVTNLVGKTEDCFNPNKEETDFFLESDKKVMASLAPLFIPEESVTETKTGNQYWFQTTKTPLVSSDGKAHHVLCVATDITARKKIEDELIKAKRIAEQSTLAKKHFLAHLSHEIRTPMNTVVGMTHLLQKTETSPEQLEYIQTLQLASDNLLGIVNDILDFSKIEAGVIEFDQERFNFSETINEVKQTLQFKTKNENLDIITQIDSEIPAFLVGDAIRLNQILSNLVSNAIKFTKTGTVAIIAKCQSQDKQNCTVVVSVEDTGVGISQDNLNHIFESFAQAGDDSRIKSGGSGLGLTIVKQLLEMQGGSISVESELNKGSTFRFILTFTKVQNGTSKIPYQMSKVTSENNRLDGIKILLTEDDKLSQRVATAILGKLGATVDVAENGKVAIAKLSEQSYDIVLMDVQMPVMDGFTATNYIRDKMHYKLPILAMTASASVETREKVLAQGMNDFITKPFNPDLLCLKIKTLVANK